MKTNLYSLLVLFLMIPAVVLAGNEKGKFTKEKKIAKTYLVNSNAGLDIINKYGNVYVTTWDEDKTSVEVIIRVSGNNEDQVDKRLNSIDVELEAVKSLVSARTKIGNMSGRTSMEINYTVKIPRNGSIKLNNQYGGIMLGKINGKSDIDCKYGDLNIDELNNESNIINIEYSGGSKAGFIKNADLTAKYSQMNISKAGKIVADCEYTGLKITDVDDITYKCSYGDISVNNANKISGTGDYLSAKFMKVNNILNVTSNYGDIKVGSLSNSVKNVAINASYTGIEINYSESFAFDFDISLEYAGHKGLTGLKFTEKREKPTEGYYRGYHKSSGNSRIFIKSEYGHLKLIKS